MSSSSHDGNRPLLHSERRGTTLRSPGHGQTLPLPTPAPATQDAEEVIHYVAALPVVPGPDSGPAGRTWQSVAAGG